MRCVFPGLVLPKTQKPSKQVKVQSWKHCSQKNVRAYRGRALAQFHLFLFFRVQYFHFVIFPERILEVLFPEKRRRVAASQAYRGRALAQFHLFLFFRVQYFHFITIQSALLLVKFKFVIY
jgi:hypothetical protein